VATKTTEGKTGREDSSKEVVAHSVKTGEIIAKIEDHIKKEEDERKVLPVHQVGTKNSRTRKEEAFPVNLKEEINNDDRDYI